MPPDVCERDILKPHLNNALSLPYLLLVISLSQYYLESHIPNLISHISQLIALH